VLYGVPEVEDLATSNEPRRAVPDPFGPSPTIVTGRNMRAALPHMPEAAGSL